LRYFSTSLFLKDAKNVSEYRLEDQYCSELKNIVDIICSSGKDFDRKQRRAFSVANAVIALIIFSQILSCGGCFESSQ